MASFKQLKEEDTKEIKMEKSIKEEKDLMAKVSTAEKKSLQCRFCEKKFGHPIFLKQHERIHTKEKPFACSTCKKIFASNSIVKFMKVFIQVKNNLLARLVKENFA